MSAKIQKVQETTKQSGDTVQTNRYVQETSARANNGQRLASNIIWFLAGVILVLLGFRFILALLGANQANAFVRFIFDTSHPLVAPFFSVFSYSNYQYGVSRFEVYTLFAMLVYAVIAWGLAALVNLNRRT